MFERNTENKTLKCSHCDSDIRSGKEISLRHLFQYRPIVCSNCENQFAFNPKLEFIYILLGSVTIALGLSLDKIRHLKATSYPEIQTHIMLIATVVFVAVAVYIHFFVPALVQWRHACVSRRFIHYLLIAVFAVFFATIGMAVVTELMG